MKTNYRKKKMEMWKMKTSNIKIIEANKSEIEAVLREVNGKAVRHTCVLAAAVIHCAQVSEALLSGLELPKNMRPGAVWVQSSGAPVANNDKRQGTRITLERAKTGWLLTCVERVELHKEGGGAGKLALTQSQYDEAVKRLMAGVSIIAAGE